MSELPLRTGDPIVVEPWPTEKPFFFLSLLAALLIWTVVAVSIVGLFYGAAFGIFFAVSHLVLIAHVRGSAVRLGPDQFPELHAAVERLARRMGLDPVPEAYLMQAGGALNAFATKFLRTNLIVLYSDLLEACGDNTAARDMIIAHELGHLRAGHLRWRWLLAPASFLPLLGQALSRAREYTSDRYGLAGAGNTDGALLGLAILAAGGEKGPKVNRRALVAQRAQFGSGFMTLGEWLGSHPPLAKRMLALDPGLAAGTEVRGSGGLRAAAAVATVFGVFMLGGVGAALVLPKWAKEAQRQGAAGQLAAPAAEPAVPAAERSDSASRGLSPGESTYVATQLDALSQFIESHKGTALPENTLAVYRAYASELRSPPPVDPFDRLPYRYTREGDSYVLSSAGPDGIPGTDDDITWRPKIGWGRGAVAGVIAGSGVR
jgi:Zn-dependent protease with chaperone function